MAKKEGIKGWHIGVGALLLLGGAVAMGGKKGASKGLLGVIRRAGKAKPEKARSSQNVTQVSEGDVRWQTVKHDDSKNIESVTYLGQNDDVIWPGSLIRGDEINQFVYRPIIFPRAPITLSVNLETSSRGKKLSEKVTSPKLSTVRQGISNLLTRALEGDTRVPARVDFSYEQVYSESDMSAFLGVDVSVGGFDLTSTFDWASYSEKTRIVAKYQQVYYSIDVDLPRSPSSWIAPGVTPEQLEQAMPEGSFPVFVATVQYGWMAILLIESDYSAEETEAALDAAYDGVPATVNIETGLTSTKVLERSKMKTIVYGGATKGIGGVVDGLKGFLDIIHESAHFSSETPGVPLAYKFRNFEDNSLALVTLTSQWSERIPFKLRSTFRVTFLGLEVLSAKNEVGAEIELDTINVQVFGWNRKFKSGTGLERRAAQGYPDQSLVTPAKGSRVYRYTGSEIDLARGQQYPQIPGRIAGNHVDVTFDTEHYPIENALLKLEVYAHEVDSAWLHDSARGEAQVIGRDFMRGGEFGVEASGTGVGRLLFRIQIEPIETFRR